MWGWLLIRRRRAHDLPGSRIDPEVTLGRPVDTVGPVQAGIEPLRRIRGGHLRRHHVAHLVVKRQGVGLGAEIAALPAPVGPAARQPAEHLAGVGLVSAAWVALDRHAALQPFRHPGLVYFPALERQSGPAEVFLGEDIDGHLGPRFRGQQVFHLEHHRTIGVGDARGLRDEGEGTEGVIPLAGVATRDLHG